MGKGGFSKAAYTQANEKAGESQQGNFKDIEKGIYQVEIKKASFKDNPTGSRTVMFGFQIDEEDEKHPNQYVWWFQTIRNTDGQDNEIGIQQLMQRFNQYSDGMFSIDDLEFNENDECTNEDEILERFVGTKLKLQISPDKPYNGQMQYKTFFQTCIDNKYQNGVNKSLEESGKSEKKEDVPFDPTDCEIVEVYVGSAVAFLKNNKQFLGRVESFVDDPTGKDENGFLSVAVTERNDKTFTKYTGQKMTVMQKDLMTVEGIPPLSNVNTSLVAEEMELDLEIESEPVKLEVGKEVTYKHNGITEKGPIHSINENEGNVVVIFVSPEGKKKGRKVALTDIVA